MRFLVILYFAFATHVAQAQEATDPRNVRELYGSSSLEIIKNPDMVFAVLLKDNAQGKIKERGKKLQLSTKLKEKLSETLISNNTYGWNIAKPCLPVYGARLIFQKGSTSIPIDFCFDCNILTARTPSKNVSEDFDSERRVFSNVFQAAFPYDRTIQSVNEEAQQDAAANP